MRESAGQRKTGREGQRVREGSKGGREGKEAEGGERK